MIFLFRIDYKVFTILHTLNAETNYFVSGLKFFSPTRIVQVWAQISANDSQFVCMQMKKKFFAFSLIMED